MSPHGTVRVWGADYHTEVLLEAPGGRPELTCDDGDEEVTVKLALTGVRKLRLALQRLERALATLEALCGTCGETFKPGDPYDLVHAEREDGELCGGAGEVTGEWAGAQ